MTASGLMQRALRGATWAAAGGSGAQVLAFVMFVIISRMVGPAAFGVVAVALLLIELCRAAAIEPVAVNLVALGNYRKPCFDAGFAMSAVAALLAAAALALGAALLAVAFRSPDLATVLPQLAPLLLVHAMARMCEAELTVRLEFRTLALRSIGAVTIGGAAGIWAAMAGHGMNALVLQQWAGALASLALLGLSSRWRPGFAFSRDDFASLARQSLALSPANLITNIRHAVDGLAVASFAGPAAAGVYSLAKRTRLALQLGLTSAIGRVSLPAFARVREAGRLDAAVQRSMRLAAFLVFPVFIGIGAIAPELIAMFLGEEWRGAAAPMTLLMIGGAIAMITRLCENVLLVQRQRAVIVGLHVFALAVLAAGLVLFGRLGPVAVAAAVLAGGIAHNIAAWLATARYATPLPARAYLANVWLPMAIGLAMLALLTLLRAAGVLAHAPEPVRLGFLIGCGAAFYLVAAWLLARPAFTAALEAGRAAFIPRSGSAQKAGGGSVP